MSIERVKNYFKGYGMEERIQEFDVSSATVELAAAALEIALLELPQAGKTVVNRFKDTSRYTSTPSFTAKGHTPPTACPIKVSASSQESRKGYSLCWMNAE